MRTTPKTLLMLAWLCVLAACQGKETPAPPAAPAAATATATTPPSPAPAVQAPVAAAAPATEAAPTLASLLCADDTLATAQARLGQDNVVAETLDGAEGETFPGWVLYPDDPKRGAEVFLDDANVHPVAVRVSSDEATWRRADGIGIGTTTAELQQRNGKPFEFLGFDWDYGGAITDWHGGKLASMKTDGSSLTLCPPEEAPTDYPAGDGAFSSDDRRMVAHPARVCEFIVPVAR